MPRTPADPANHPDGRHRAPDLALVAQQARDLVLESGGCVDTVKFLIRDRDRKFHRHV